MYLQAKRLEEQNTILGSQNDLLEKQNELLGSQNSLVESQALRMEKQNEILGSQNNLIEFQSILTKYQVLSEMAAFLGESQSVLSDLSNSVALVAEYERIIHTIVEGFPRYQGQDISDEQCAGMAGCKRIESIDSLVLDDWPFAGSVQDLRRLYLTSASIRRAYDELLILFDDTPDEKSERLVEVEQAMKLDSTLRELVGVCGLLHHPELTTHDNDRLGTLSYNTSRIAYYFSRIANSWEIDDVPVNERLGYSQYSIDNLNYFLDTIVSMGRPDRATSWDDGRIAFAKNLSDIRELMLDLQKQCRGKKWSNYEAIRDLLAEYAAKAYGFIYAIMEGSMSEEQLPLTFEQSMVDTYRQTRDIVGDETLVLPGGVRVGPWPAK